MMGQNNATTLHPLQAPISLSESGTKAFNLGRLLRSGMPSAAGNIIPNWVFQEHLTDCQLHGDIAQLQAELSELDQVKLQIRSQEIQHRILSQELSQHVRQSLQQEMNLDGKQQYAVRSSAVGEDAANASFAGQLKTVLHVEDLAQLEVAIRQVWASLFSESLLQYAKHKGLFLSKMGVVIQTQVKAKFSGVLFTRPPQDANEKYMLLEFCEGLGDDLVSGVITPSSIKIERDHGTLEHDATELGRKLGAAQLRCIEQLRCFSLQLENLFGSAQDIEWSIDEADQLVILQSRPITHFSNRLESAKSVEPVDLVELINAQTTKVQTKENNNLVYWSNANIAENFPDPVTPFLHSIVTRGYSAYFRNLGRGFGLSEKAMSAKERQFEQVVGVHAGRLYYNLSNIHQLIHLAPGGAWLAESFNLFTGASASPQSENRLPSPSFPVQLLINCRVVLKTCWQYLRIQSQVTRFETKVLDFAARCKPDHLAQQSRAQLHQHLRDFLEIRLRQWNGAALADTAAMACYGMLKQFLAQALPEQEQAPLHNHLLKGLPDLISARPVSELWALSREVRANAALFQLFQEQDAAVILFRLQQSQFKNFYQQFTAYLEEWGFRSSGELMLTQPTPYEDPLPTLRVLQQYAREIENGPDELSAKQANLREHASAEVEAKLSPWAWWRALPLLSRAARFRILLKWTQASIRLRERARFKQALLYIRLRQIALQLGEHFVSQGILQQKEDVFFLTADEVQALAQGCHLLSRSMSKTVEARRAAFLEYAENTPPDSFSLPYGEQWQVGDIPAQHEHVRHEIEPKKNRLFGSSACGGKIQGKASVVLDVSDAHRIRSGDILVTKQTDPGWASVFFLVKGLVIERGGMLSHGAIIAREYGIPAVVGVPNASSRIQDGTEILIDGDQAWIDLVSEPHH